MELRFVACTHVHSRRCPLGRLVPGGDAPPDAPMRSFKSPAALPLEPGWSGPRGSGRFAAFGIIPPPKVMISCLVVGSRWINEHLVSLDRSGVTASRVGGRLNGSSWAGGPGLQVGSWPALTPQDQMEQLFRRSAVSKCLTRLADTAMTDGANRRER